MSGGARVIDRGDDVTPVGQSTGKPDLVAPVPPVPMGEHQQGMLASSGRRIPWLFREDGKDREILAAGSYCCSDDVLGGVTLAKSGAGLFQTYRFIVERELEEGSLVEVLTAFGGRSRPFTLLYPHGRHVPLRLRAFVDFLMECKLKWSV